MLLHCIVQWVLQVMSPSACSFIVCWFPPSFTTCFGLHGHLQVCMILHIFIFICLRILLRCFFGSLPFLHVVTLCMFSICGVDKVVIGGVIICSLCYFFGTVICVFFTCVLFLNNSKITYIILHVHIYVPVLFLKH
jgi:hypothetical protein